MPRLWLCVIGREQFQMLRNGLKGHIAGCVGARTRELTSLKTAQA
jgi:hypothetical protein